MDVDATMVCSASVVSCPYVSTCCLSLKEARLASIRGSVLFMEAGVATVSSTTERILKYSSELSAISRSRREGFDSPRSPHSMFFCWVMSTVCA